jgi:hypothetical protein
LEEALGDGAMVQNVLPVFLEALTNYIVEIALTHYAPLLLRLDAHRQHQLHHLEVVGYRLGFLLQLRIDDLFQLFLLQRAL